MKRGTCPPQNLPPAQRALLAKWCDVPIGAPVLVKMDDGTIFFTRVRGAAFINYYNHRAVIHVDGAPGITPLERVELASSYD